MLENIFEDLFSELKALSATWEVGKVRLLNETEKILILKAVIVDIDFETKCCFYMKNGTKTFLPIDINYTAKGIGESLDIDKIEIVKYVSEGQSPINRVREKSSDLEPKIDALNSENVHSSSDFNKSENIFYSLKYKTNTFKSVIFSVRLLNDTEKNLIRRAEIVLQDNYFKSCCFFMKNGTRTFLPIDINYTVKDVGKTLDIDKIEIVKYVRDGDSPINRVREKSSDLRTDLYPFENTTQHSLYIIDNYENVFSGLRHYSDWEVAGVLSLKDYEKNLIRKAEIISSEYGNNCCFFFKNGTKTSIPMDKDYTAKGVGELLDLDKIEIVKYVRDSDSPINRIREKQ